MAEWLGNGLQNRLQRFESAWYLKVKGQNQRFGLFLLLNSYFTQLSANLTPTSLMRFKIDYLCTS